MHPIRRYLDILAEADAVIPPRGLNGIDAIRKPDEPTQATGKVDRDAQKRARTKTLASVLRSHGFSEIGSGGYSLIFGHPKLDYIVKIFVDDPCYRRFVGMLRKVKNVHFPRLIGNVMQLPGENLFGVRMEKLAKFKYPMSEFEENAIDAYLLKSEPIYRDDDLIREVYGPQFVEALDILIAHCGSDCTFDIHEDNLMERPGAVVIIDPYKTPDPAAHHE